MSRDLKAFTQGHAETLSVPAPMPLVPEVEDRPLVALYWTLFQARLLVCAITLGFVLLGVLYVALATPTYRADAVVQVEETTRGVAGLAELTGLGERLPSETEIQILGSRGLVGSVVDDLNLTVTAAPRHFPLLGALARRHEGAAPAPAPAGLGSWAWGGERIAVTRLSVPPALLDRPLTLVAAAEGAYRLLGPDGDLMVTGEVGKAAAGARGGAPVECFVSDLVARPGTRFTVMRRGRLRTVEDLQSRLRVSEKGRSTGILAIHLDGPDPALAASILDAITMSYVRQNVERRSAEAAKTLEFLETQLPILRSNLDAAEAALRAFQARKGMVDLPREAQAMLERTVEIERALSVAQMERTDLRQRFTPSHGAVIAVDEKIRKLHDEQAAMSARMRNLPATELESVRLSRDVKVSSELYDLLLNRAQELRVVKSGTIGNVRILDRAAVSDRPVTPVTSLVLLLSLLAGLGAGVAVAVGRKSLYAGLDDPEAIEHLTGMTVYATIPRSLREVGLNRAGARQRRPRLAAVAPEDPAVEALRSLRTGLQFALLEARNGIVVITGPTAGVGKSFVAVNLGHVLASAGRRVLLVDADLRRGNLHRFFDGARAPGLSDVLTENASLAEAVHASDAERLSWVSTGTLPPNPSELLTSERFEVVLADLARAFDVVLVDTAPILPVTDAAVIGRLAACVLLVLRAGAHPAREIQLSVKRLAQNGVRRRAAVLNDVSGAGARYSKYAYQYRYDVRR